VAETSFPDIGYLIPGSKTKSFLPPLPRPCEQKSTGAIIVIAELLRNRFSVRCFENKPIPEPVILEILEAGRLSPSGGNEQPWLFGVINDPILIAQVAQIAYQQQWIAKAPLLIVLCTIPAGDDRGGREIQMQRYPELSRAIADMDPELYWSLNQEEHQTKIAGTHMALAALEHGIGSCWVSRFEVKRLAELLALPERTIPAEILVFGYPPTQRKSARKKDLGQVVFYNRY
jgi:nitroreductase